MNLPRTPHKPAFSLVVAALLAPRELRSVAADPAYEGIRAALEAELARLRKELAVP